MKKDFRIVDDNFRYEYERNMVENNYKEIYKKAFVSIGIIVINIVVYFITEIIGDTLDSNFMLEHGAVYLEGIYEKGEYWRFLTAMFLHFGMNHLLNNMLILACSGYILEEALGHFKFLLLYVCSGLAGGVVSYIMMFYSGEQIVSAGASGAIFGVVGGLLWVVIKNKGHYEKISWLGLLFMIYLVFSYGLKAGNIDNWDHLGGLVCGFVMGLILYRKINILKDEK